MTNTELFVGLISGTSVDGVDCALVSFDEDRPQLIDSHFKATDSALREKILRLCEGDNLSLDLLGSTDVEIGRVFAEAVNELLAKAGLSASDISAIGSHGQTVWHQPEGTAPFTLQIGDPNTIAQQTGITTVADFRRRDLAAGGEGAPLAPLLHRNIFQSSSVDRAVINIGGIANITVLPQDGACFAFDTGPGNVLMDYWIGKHQNQRYDENGSWAAEGNINLGLLNSLLAEDYFKKTPPKSTGREKFNGRWLEQKLEAFAKAIDPADVQATLLTFTVTTIVSDITSHTAPQEIYVCGGGVHNKTLMSELSKIAGECSVASTSALGIDPDWVEAMAFAWMARKTIAMQPLDTTPFTGAMSPIILGGIYKA